MKVILLLVLVTAFLTGLVQARTKSPLLDEDLPRSRNKAAGTISVGAGYTQMNEMLTTMELPPITPLLFTKVQRTLQDNVHATLMEQLALAGKEEKKLAIERGDVDGNGVPFITVIADGAWSKRSYKTNYNALSGVAVIIGEATKKVLFMGVKNKFCIVCVRTRGKEHVCAKNWTGSSTSMESAIIMEGFKNSEAMHGVRYTKLIGDGDSSITKKLLEEKPYGAVLVEKVECVNHLLRNMCNKLKEITKSTRSSSLLKNISVALRKKLGNNILKFRTSIKKAAEFRNKEPTDFLKKVNDFKKDVLNSPNHIFGEHKNCDTYFCDKKDKNENIVPMLKECGMYQDICFALQRIVGCASSILLNKNNNPAEQFNAVVNKFVGGKRINFSGQKSYEMRCELAAISYNCKDNYFLEILKSAGIEAGHFIKNLVRDKGLKRKREAQFKEKRIKKKYKQTLANHEPDADYGAIEETLSAEELERRKIKLQTILKKTDEEILDLEKNTRGQGSNHRWLEERSCRLTASNFGLICKRRKANPHLLAKRLYSNPFTGNKSTRYGLDFEPLAINTFQEATGLKVNSCGLFVGRDEEYFLGASPDGVIGTDSILEIKCPAVLKKISVEDGISSKKIKYLQIDESECIFGKQIRELGSQWIPDLGVPIGVLYCMKCECVPFQRKRRIVARVQCRNIKNECPEPTCEDPVLLPERCCKTCLGDNKNEPDVIQDIVPQNAIEEEEKRINHFAALLTGRSSLDLRNDSIPKDLNKNNVVATGRFTFHKRNLHYSFYISEKAARPRSLHFMDSQGNILEEFTLSHAGGLVNSLYQNATRKVCGIWRRLPRDYRRLLKQEKMYVVLIWGTKDTEFTLSGKLTKYVALGSELFSSLLEPAPGTDSTRMAGSGGTAIVSTSSTPSPSIHIAVVFNGLFTNQESLGVPINVMLAVDEKRQILLEGNIKVNMPAPDLNFIEISTPISLADLRSLSRGRILLTVSSISEPNALRLSGSVITKVTCEIFQTTLIGEKDIASTTSGLAWMYLNNQGALIYSIQVDNMDQEQFHTVTLTDTTGKKKAEVLTPAFHDGWANGTEDRLVHKILEPLYNSRLDMRIAVGNSSLHGHLSAKLVADARDAPAPLLLKRENYSLPSTVVGLAWISVDSDCHIHYDISISGLGHEKKLQLYLEMYPIIAPGAPVLIKPLEEFVGNQAEGSPIDILTKEELDMLDTGVNFIKLKDYSSGIVLLSATLTKVKLPISCRPSHRDKDNIVPVIYDIPGGAHPTEDCFFEGKFYKKDSTWVSKNPCQMCFCQDGQASCDRMTCPDVKCSPHNNLTNPGECCPVCEDPEILKSNQKCVFNGMTYSSGSKFHPFLIPIGFDDCTICTCDPIDFEIKCRRIESNSAKCGKGAVTTPETLSEDDIRKWSVKRKEEVSNTELTIKEGGCKNFNNPEKPYKNGSTYHPYIASLGEYKCVTCKCQNGTQTCARERCEWKNCKMVFDVRKTRTKNNKKMPITFSDYCCSLKECRKIRHKKKVEERASHKQ